MHDCPCRRELEELQKFLNDIAPLLERLEDKPELIEALYRESKRFPA